MRALVQTVHTLTSSSAIVEIAHSEVQTPSMAACSACRSNDNSNGCAPDVIAAALFERAVEHFAIRRHCNVVHCHLIPLRRLWAFANQNVNILQARASLLPRRAADLAFAPRITELAGDGACGYLGLVGCGVRSASACDQCCIISMCMRTAVKTI